MPGRELQRLAGFLATLPAAVLVLDREGRLVQINARARGLLALEPGARAAALAQQLGPAAAQWLQRELRGTPQRGPAQPGGPLAPLPGGGRARPTLASLGEWHWALSLEPEPEPMADREEGPAGQAPAASRPDGFEAIVGEFLRMFELPDMGLAFFRDGRLQQANEAFAQLSGYSRAELAALDPDALVEGEARPLREAQQRALRLHGRWSGERPLRRKDGTPLRVQVAKRLVDPADPSRGMIASYLNVEARVRAEQALMQLAERTRAVLDSVLVGLVTVGEDGIRWMNRSARRMFAGELRDFVGQPLAVVAAPQAQHPFLDARLHLGLEPGAVHGFECRVRARDGRDYWVVGNVVRTGRREDDRELTYALMDIDRRRRAEEHMAEAQASLQRLIELAPLGIVVRDARELRVLQINQRAADNIGRPVEALRGTSLEEVFPAEAARRYRADMLAALASGRVVQAEYRLGPEGAERVLDVRCQPLAHPGEPPDRLLLLATDVTEQRAAQQARLEEALQQRDLLVREVHHRIKNNLQGVAGLLQQLAARKPEVAPVIDEVAGQVLAIAHVYGLQVEASGPLGLPGVLGVITGSVARTFDRAIVLQCPQAEEGGWMLPEAEAIPIALTLNELLTNAVKHSPAGAAVSCRLCGEEGGAVRIEVLNPGRLRPGLRLDALRGGVSGLGLVRALLPRRHARLSLVQQGEAVHAEVRLEPPCVSPPGAAPGAGGPAATIGASS